MKMKKNYEKPETAVTRVELESPICSSSDQYAGQDVAEEGIVVNGQDVVTPGTYEGEGGATNTYNDFSGTEWTGK